LVSLDEWPPGRQGVVARLRDQTPEMLRYLAQKGLIVGARVEVITRDPFDGPLTLAVEAHEQVIGLHVAKFVLICPQEI
jgi:DtxR family Mn-dependent transcriptional regulator